MEREIVVAVSSNTKIAINGEFSRLKHLTSGDVLVSSHGTNRRVGRVEHRNSDALYALTFTDGSLLYCDDNTAFPLTGRWDRIEDEEKTEFLTPSQLVNSEPNYWGCKLNAQYRGTKNPLTEKIHPYVLGLWAAGTIKESDLIVKLSPECYHDLEERGYELSCILNGYDVTPFMLSAHLKTFSLPSHSIPMEYIFAPVEDRRELLRGLTVMANKRNFGHVSLTLSNITLLSNIRILLSSLGVITTIKRATYNDTHYYTISFPKNYVTADREADWNKVKNVVRIKGEMQVTDLTIKGKARDYTVGDTFIPVSR